MHHQISTFPYTKVVTQHCLFRHSHPPWEPLLSAIGLVPPAFNPARESMHVQEWLWALVLRQGSAALLTDVYKVQWKNSSQLLRLTIYVTLSTVYLNYAVGL